MTIFKLAQFNSGNIDTTKGLLTPLDPSTIAGDNPLISFLWTIGVALFSVAVYGFLLAMIIGGAQYLLSLGDENAITKAKKTFINATIGLIIVFMSYQIVNFFLKQFGPIIVAGSIPGIVAGIYQIVIGLGGAIFLLILLFGGFRYMLAAGNDEAAATAKKQMTAGVIGIVLIAFAFGIGRTILVLLQIPISG